MMFQRMYMMLTFFTVAYLYINIIILKDNYSVNKKRLFCIFIIAVLGFLTQYFFAIYAAIISLIMIILFIINKKYKEMFKYIITLIIAAIVGLLIFPFAIDHLVRSDRGIGSFSATNYIDRVYTYFNLILRYFGSKFEITLALFAIALLAIVIRRKKERDLISIIVIPVIGYVMIIAKLTEFLELRYVMNILPIIAIMIMMAVSSIFENKAYNYLIAIATLILLTTYGFLTETPLYLYKDYSEYIEISEKYSEDDLVYVGYTFFNHMQSLQEFMNYNKTLMIYNDQLDILKDDEELKDKNEFILSASTSMDPEKILQTVMENTGYTNYEILHDGSDEIEQRIYRIYR